MELLTKVEEQVMQLIWEIGRGTVRDIMDKMGEPKPPHSTVSSVVRILEKKNFVSHKAYGRTYEYYPIIPKEDYSNFKLKGLTNNYFEGSYKSLVSFLVKEKNLSSNELNEIMDLLNNENE